MIISGRHAAQTEREQRGLRVLVPGVPLQSSVVTFRDFAFHGPFSVLGLSLRGNHNAVILTGIKGYWAIPFDCTISYYTLLADNDGSMVLDIYKTTFANFPPASTDTICALSSERPHLANNKLFIDRRLAGWRTVLKKNDILAVEVMNALAVSSVTLSLFVTRNNQP